MIDAGIKNLTRAQLIYATCGEKAGKKYKGYVANVKESVGPNGFVITDYDYQPNTQREHLS